MIVAALRHGLAGTAVAACLGVLPGALHAQPDFGDDTSQWANDGECDDPRFEGEGAAETLLAEDRGHDAADCRMLFNAGRITLLGAALASRIEHDGRLEAGDTTLTSGEYYDSFEFEGSPGQHVAIDLRSSAFDTYLILQDPAGEQTENDDAEDGDEVGHSSIAADLTEAGTYRVLVTSYDSGETGAYSLTIDPAAAAHGSPAPHTVPTLTAGGPVRGELDGSAGRLYGLFAGISDYQPPNTDLEYTAEDAKRIRDALIDGGGMRAEDAYTLVNDEATVGNVTSAIRAIASRMSPDDTFVMFYSGHGGQLERSDGPTASDPDAMDETLTLYDGDLRDDDLRALFDEIDRGTVLLWLDSCFSGGFAKDIVSAPGRMGIFSSEEDITSNVASKFRAGGYLSHFLDGAIAQGLADADGDRSITAIELSQYLHERYRADVKSTERAVVRTEMTLGYQHLVVDRGSIGANDVLFAR